MEKITRDFWHGFLEGFDTPLSLSIPEIKRRSVKRIVLRKSRLGNQKTDLMKLNGDMKRAMKYVKAAQ